MSSSRKSRKDTFSLPNLSNQKKKKDKKKKKKKKLLLEDPRLVRDLIHFAETNGISGLKTIFDGTEYEKKYDFNQSAGECLVKAAENGHSEALSIICDTGIEILKKEKITKKKFKSRKKKGNKDDNLAPLTIANLMNGKPLQHCSASGQLHCCQLLVLNYFADVNSKSAFFEMTPLHYAAKNGKEEICKFLIGQGAKVDAVTHSENCGVTCGWSALHLSADGGFVNIVRLLIDSGAMIDLKTVTGDTALAIASERGQWSVVRYLVSIGADIHATRRGLSVVNWAIYRAEADAVQYLVSYGAKPDLTVRTTWLPSNNTLSQTIEEQFSESVYEQVDLAIYRGGKQVKERELKRKIVAEINWEDKAVYDPYSFDPLPQATVKRFNDYIINLIVSYDM